MNYSVFSKKSIYFLLFLSSNLVSAEESNDRLCDLTAQQGFIKQAKELGLDVESVVSAKVNSQCQASTLESKSEEVRVNFAKYQVEAAADLSRGNYEQNEYQLAAKREQDITHQLKWEMSAKWRQLEMFENDEREVFEVFQFGSQITYQKRNNPKLITFLDLSTLKDDFIGLEQEISVTLGAGYALWGESYHSSCDVLKFSLGLGNKQRKLVNVDSVSQQVVSHKIGFSMLLKKTFVLTRNIYDKTLLASQDKTVT